MRRLLAATSALLLPAVLLLAADPAKPASDPVITDAAGKEIVLKKWKLAAGTRPLAWLGKDGAGPEALAFRETHSTLFKDGVLTLIPLARLQSLTYDAEKQLVSARVAGLEQPLTGWAKYQGINQISIEAEVDKGEAGTVELKYRGGVTRGGIRGVKFPGAKAGETPKGEKTYVTVMDGQKREAAEPVYQLQALYRVDKGSEKLLPTVMFKKTFKVDLAQVQKMTVQESADQKGFECEVTLKDGSEQTLTLLTAIPLDGKTATLEGFLGVVPAGYKLFPIHTVGAVSREEPKADKEPGKADKEKEP